MKFIAELIKVESVKTLSQDRECKLVFKTGNSEVLRLGHLEADTLFLVDIDIYNDNDGKNRV